MKKPFFSIITCTKDSEKFILRNIESVEKQTYKNYEQIFIDGKSADNTLAIIKKFAKKYPEKFKLYIHPPKGISNAFNNGIKRSRGEYLFFLNSDDFYYDDIVLKDLHTFIKKNKSLDWVYGKINVVEEDGKTVGTFPNWRIFQKANKILLKYINYIPHQAVFMKRDVFKKYGNFDEGLKTSMDRDLWLRISGKTKWQFFDRIIAGYTIRSGSATSSKKAWKENLDRMHDVQKRHLTETEVILSKMINKAVFLINKKRR